MNSWARGFSAFIANRPKLPFVTSRRLCIASVLDPVDMISLHRAGKRYKSEQRPWQQDATQLSLQELTAGIVSFMWVERVWPRVFLAETADKLSTAFMSLNLKEDYRRLALIARFKHSSGASGSGRVARVSSGLTSGINCEVLPLTVSQALEFHQSEEGRLARLSGRQGVPSGAQGDAAAAESREEEDEASGDAATAHTFVNGSFDFSKIRRLVSDRRTRLLSDFEAMFVAAARDVSMYAGEAALALVREPNSITAINQLTRAISSAEETLGVGTSALHVRLPVARYYNANPHRNLAALMMSAPDLASRRKYGFALQRYLDAYEMDPSQPLTCLCIASSLSFLYSHPLVKKRREVILKGLAALCRYRTLRLEHKLTQQAKSFFSSPPSIFSSSFSFATASSSHASSNGAVLAGIASRAGVGSGMTGSGRVSSRPTSEELLSELGRRQEVLYNFGRYFQDLKLFHLAADHYIQAIELAEQNPSLASGALHLTREAALNLCLIYKQSGARDLALDVMVKHLSF